MPLDALSTFYGDDCLKCRKEPRLENQRWGEQCLAASRLWREQYVAAVAKEDYTSIPYRVRHQTPPPPPARARCSADESLPALWRQCGVDRARWPVPMQHLRRAGVATVRLAFLRGGRHTSTVQLLCTPPCVPYTNYRALQERPLRCPSSATMPVLLLISGALAPWPAARR